MKPNNYATGVRRLQTSFELAWRALGASTTGGFSEVVARHSQSHRAYHTLDHILDCHELLRAAGELAERRYEVELALIYHDVVYDPWRSDNEKRSAALFLEHAKRNGLPLQAAARISAHIEATSTHHATCLDGALLNDIDLAVLAACPARYATFERQIRQEYVAVEESLFSAARQRLLCSLLDKKSIYATPYFVHRFEVRARRNLARTLSRLQEAEGRGVAS